MKADILTLKDLFQKQVRYVVPMFQRPYVWSQEDQWEPLWDDVRNTAERYLEELQRAGEGLDAPIRAEREAKRHFLGAVVLQQRPASVRDIQQREIIDGQQRLITLQLLLDAAQEVCEQLGLADQAKRLSRLVLNREDEVSDPDHVFKVWPTNVDREPFRHAMHNGLPVDEYEDSRIVQAHEYFQLQIRHWLEEQSSLTTLRAQALETALLGLLQMVVIDLEPQDDAQIIFETLNARGTPLIASDLVKNFVLHRVREQGARPGCPLSGAPVTV